MSTTCSAASRAAAEPLAATATEAVRWLLLEVRGPWGRDAIADTPLPADVRTALAAFDGRVVLVRRPDRRGGVTLIGATVAEQGGKATVLELESVDELPEADLEHGVPLAEPVFLVCTHGRRDACCARLGRPLYDALAPQLSQRQLWQSSHLGGHRFAPNVLVLPAGVLLGRVPPERAAEVVELLAGGRIPLDLYRGRTVHAPSAQAAEILVRTVTGCDAVAGLQLLAHEGDRVTFSTPAGELTARVERRPGPSLPASCGGDPEPTVRWVASLESSA